MATMSTATDAGVTGFGRAALIAAKEPVVYIAATAPIWARWLENISELAGKLAPVFAILLALARIYTVLTERSDNGAHRFSRVEKAGGIAGATVSTAAKLGGKWLAPALGAIGLVALAAWMLTPSKAHAITPQQSRPAGKRKSKDDAGEDDGPLGEFQPGREAPPQWYLNAYADRGTREIYGKRHNSVIVKYFSDAGFPGIRNDETAWCAAFVNAHLERQGVPGSKSLAARSFEKWGEETEPRLGCIVVMSRGDPKGWQGHVGFYAGETATHVMVLGGNQADSVSLAKFPKARVIGYRWPRNPTNSRTVRAAVGSAVLGTTGQGLDDLKPEDAKPVLEAIEPIQGTLSQAAPFLPLAGKIAAAMAVALAIYAAVRRYQDFKARGM